MNLSVRFSEYQRGIRGTGLLALGLCMVFVGSVVGAETSPDPSTTQSPAAPSTLESGADVDGGAEVSAEGAAPRDARGGPPVTSEFFETVVVTATARPEGRRDVPYAVESLDTDRLRSGQMARSVPDALRESAGIMVQKTSQGQGSPYLRGFTGFRNVFLVDGVRLNNAVFRDGPNQYWNTVDVLGLQELEVVKGPVSVLYGSEAVGGTVNALTREPPVAGLRASSFGGSLYGRFASADESTVGRLELSGASRTGLRWLVGGSFKNFGDLQAGSEVGEQPQTGYDELNADAKVRYALGGGSEWVASWQQVDIDDAWRTHKTVFGRSFRGTSVGDEQRRVLDQERTLAHLRLHHDSRVDGGGWLGLYDTMNAGLSWHQQGETRDRVRRDGRRDEQGFDVDSLGLRLQFHKDAAAAGRFVYGVESYRDSVDSFKLNYDRDGVFTGASLQGPVADDATYWLQGAYVQHQSLWGQRLRLTVGARYTHARAMADAVVDPVQGGTFRLDASWDQVVGHARFVLPVDANQRVRLFGGISQAFRAPNLSDTTRFDSARSNEFETPSPDLDPETFVAYELGIQWDGLQSSVELTAHHTEIDSLIIRTPTGRVLDGEFEITKKNGGSGYSRGLELRAQHRWADRWMAFATVSWADGEIDTFPTSTSSLVREPLDRLMPLTSHVGLRWQEAGRPWWLEGLVTVADRQDRLSSRDQADTQRIPLGGTPGYEVWTLRGGWQVSDRWTLSGGIENLTDATYRIHGSGVTEAGRNFLLAVQLNF